MPVIPTTWEAKDRTTVRGQSEQQVSETPISTNKPGMVVHIYNSNYAGGCRLED
jgi:hypothetical protein